MGRAETPPGPAAQIASRDMALLSLRDALAAHDGDPASQLYVARAVRDAAASEVDCAIVAARDAGVSFGRIARALGINRQSVHRRYRLLTGRGT